MDCFWKELRGEPFYRFQTEDKKISEKMRRRNKFSIISWGLNCNFWIYHASFSRSDIAIKAFQTLTGEKAIFNSADDVYYSKEAPANSTEISF